MWSWNNETSPLGNYPKKEWAQFRNSSVFKQSELFSIELASLEIKMTRTSVNDAAVQKVLFFRSVMPSTQVQTQDFLEVSVPCKSRQVTSDALQAASRRRQKDLQLLQQTVPLVPPRRSNEDINFVASIPSTQPQWPCGVVVACLLHTQEVPGSIPGRGSYLRQVSLH